ncbi:TPA: hypothetical protein RFY31_004261 [Klebsiella aerogenes]|nr:hypothetical protein [Klebsiella aerogenes]MDA3991995.1 hypothetical protein [Klebsiella aerogenes]HDS6597075.1 hypothetical protein [Klebsiella aerogenes]HDU6304531.1 hypothetical protein [Klebsiella aerogenes]
MSFREWKEANGIGRKTHTCRAETEQWLNKEPARYVEPLPPDFPGVRLDDATLKPREHAVPESTTGQNAFLKACREFLICDDSILKRIC